MQYSAKIVDMSLEIGTTITKVELLDIAFIKMMQLLESVYFHGTQININNTQKRA